MTIPGGDELASATVSVNLTLNEQQAVAAATRAAQTVERQFARVQGRFASQAQQATAIKNLANTFAAAGVAANQLGTRISALQRIQQAATNITNKFGTSITAAAIGITALSVAVVKVGSNFARIAGDFQELEQSINAIVTTSVTANTTTKEFLDSLRGLALESGRSSQQLANTGRQFLALGFSGSKTTKILDSFTKAASLTGASNEQLRLALNGVSQIASKGAVAMEELRRQIAENLPGAVNLARFFEIVAENLGITTAEAKKLQEAGKLTSEVGIKALVQTLDEATEGLDVFALRANTLSGAIGILREGFTQAVQTGFRPFIDQLVPVLRALTQGANPFAQITGQLERFGQVLGTSLVDILKAVLPLIPELIDLFIDLTVAIAPMVTDLIETGAVVARILVPAFSLAAQGVNILFNELGPLSTLIRALAGGALIGGLIKGFAIFGRAAGSIGGLLGRIATPITSILGKISEFSFQIGGITAGLGAFKVVLAPLSNLTETFRVAIIALGLAFLALKVEAVSTALATKYTAAISAATTSIATLRTGVQSAIIAVGGLRSALLALGTVTLAAAAINAFGNAFSVANRKADELVKTVTKDIDTSSLTGMEAGLKKIAAEQNKAADSFNALGGRAKTTFTGAIELLTPMENKLIDSRKALDGLNKAFSDFELRTRVMAPAILNAVSNATKVTFDEIERVAREIGIDFSKIPFDQELATIKKLTDAVQESLASLPTQSLTDLLDKMEENFDKTSKAAKAAADASKGLASAHRALEEATKRVQELEAERSTLLSETSRDVREVIEAEEKLTRTRFKLRDLGQEEIAIQEELNDLRQPASADELAEADRRIERAKLALNEAMREEQALLESLNEDQKISFDLTGLTLDQLRSKLSNIRATLNAQRAGNKEEDNGATLAEKQTSARLDVADAQQTLNEALETRTTLDNRVLNNAIDIRELEERLLELAIDRAAALRDEGDEQITLNKLRAGDTTRARELKDVEEQIIDAKVRQRDAANNVRDAEIEVRDAMEEQKKIVAEIEGIEGRINGLALIRLGLAKQFTKESALQAATALVQTLPGFAPLGPGVQGPFTPQASSIGLVQQIADALLNNPNALRDILKKLGVPFATGGLITSPTFAQMGERFKPELVLPLSRPDRVWSLLSQNLPKYPGAMAAAQTALQPSYTARSLGAGLNPMRRGDGPMTYDQAQEMIDLLKKSGTGEIKIEAPIQVVSQQPARQIAGHLERLARKKRNG